MQKYLLLHVKFHHLHFYASSIKKLGKLHLNFTAEYL